MLVPFKPQFQVYFVPIHYTKLCPVPPGKRSQTMSTLYVRVAEIGLNNTYVYVAQLGLNNTYVHVAQLGLNNVYVHVAQLG